MEEDYAQFVKATGFNYEKDLDRFALAFSQQSKEPLRFAIAEGRFDRKKIEEYAERFGLRISHNGVVVFSINWKNAARPSFFTFLHDGRIAWTDDPSYAALFQKQRSASSSADWAERFSRLGGTPIFAVLASARRLSFPTACFVAGSTAVGQHRRKTRRRAAPGGNRRRMQ